LAAGYGSFADYAMFENEAKETIRKMDNAVCAGTLT